MLYDIKHPHHFIQDPHPFSITDPHKNNKTSRWEAIFAAKRAEGVPTTAPPPSGLIYPSDTTHLHSPPPGLPLSPPPGLTFRPPPGLPLPGIMRSPCDPFNYEDMGEWGEFLRLMDNMAKEAGRSRRVSRGNDQGTRYSFNTKDTQRSGFGKEGKGGKSHGTSPSPKSSMHQRMRILRRRFPGFPDPPTCAPPAVPWNMPTKYNEADANQEQNTHHNNTRIFGGTAHHGVALKKTIPHGGEPTGSEETDYNSASASHGRIGNSARAQYIPPPPTTAPPPPPSSMQHHAAQGMVCTTCWQPIPFMKVEKEEEYVAKKWNKKYTGIRNDGAHRGAHGKERKNLARSTNNDAAGPYPSH